MPTYEYECDACRECWAAELPLAERDSAQDCPACGRPTARNLVPSHVAVGHSSFRPYVAQSEGVPAQIMQRAIRCGRDWFLPVGGGREPIQINRPGEILDANTGGVVIQTAAEHKSYRARHGLIDRRDLGGSAALRDKFEVQASERRARKREAQRARARLAARGIKVGWRAQ